MGRGSLAESLRSYGRLSDKQWAAAAKIANDAPGLAEELVPALLRGERFGATTVFGFGRVEERHGACFRGAWKNVFEGDGRAAD